MASESLTLEREREREGSTILETLHDWAVTVDHKRLGILYIVYGIVFLAIGGLEAAIMRIQLMTANNHFVTPQVFNRMMTMHGTTMVFLVGVPILFGFGNYLVPLMIGARDMAFPRLNALGFCSPPSAVFSLLQLHRGEGLAGAGSADVGWLPTRPSPRRRSEATAPITDARRPSRLRHRNGHQHRHHRHFHALPGMTLARCRSWPGCSSPCRPDVILSATPPPRSCSPSTATSEAL